MSRDCPSRSALHLGLQPLRPASATTTSADFWLHLSSASGFHPQGQISPGKNAILPRTAVASTSPRLDHKSFAIIGLLALLGAASYALRVPRLAVSLRASSPHSVTLMQLHFTSLAVVSSREDLHLQDRAHAGRTKKKGSPQAALVAAVCTEAVRAGSASTQPKPLQPPRRPSPHRPAPVARPPVPRPPASRWPCARRRPWLPSPCAHRGTPCRYRPGSGGQR